MKLTSQLENIIREPHSSMSILKNPRLNDFYFWHFHPELELVYLNGADGSRQVGNHKGNFKQSDMVLIGSQIPHLNFDYGIKNNYKVIVYHFEEGMLDKLLSEEFYSIRKLLQLAQYGVLFSKPIQNQLGPQLWKIAELPVFERFQKILELLDQLSRDNDIELLHSAPFINPIKEKEQARLKRVYRYIDLNYQNAISIEQVASEAYLGREAFCRFFKNMTQLTFTDFLNHYRIDKAKEMLQSKLELAEIANQCGFESQSYFNKIFKKITQTTPTDFREKIII